MSNELTKMVKQSVEKIIGFGGKIISRQSKKQTAHTWPTRREIVKVVITGYFKNKN